MWEHRTVGEQEDDNDTNDTLTRYIYSNHLQSTSLELDENGVVISYEEYHPYGTTSFQANNAEVQASAKRYRYTGKERDDESGLYYHGARYYIPWLGRWTAVDPINSTWYNLTKGYGWEKNSGRHFTELTASSYEYCYDNPVRFTDPTGEQVPVPVEAEIPVEHVPLTRSGGPIRDNGRPLAPTDRGIGVRYAEAAAHDYTGAGSNSMAIERLKQLLRPEPALPPLPTPEQSRSAMQKFSQSQRSPSGLFVNKAAEDAYWKSKGPQNKIPLEKITTDVSKLSNQDKQSIINRMLTGKGTVNDHLLYSKVMGEISVSLRVSGLLHNIYLKSSLGHTRVQLEGVHSLEDIMAAGMAFVGKNAKPIFASESKKFIGWESSDKLRRFRPPVFKKDLEIIQANFEQRANVDIKWSSSSGESQRSNVHVVSDKKFNFIKSTH